MSDNEEKKDVLQLYFDGGNERDIAVGGMVAKFNNATVAEFKVVVHPNHEQTNNVAEYSALRLALLYAFAEKANYDEFEFYGDSQLVIRQVLGEYACGKPHLKEFLGQCWAMRDKIEDLGKKCTFEWIPRDRNDRADTLGHEIRAAFLANH